MEKKKKDGINTWCDTLLPFIKKDEYGNMYLQKKGSPHEYVMENDSGFGRCVYEYIEGFDVKNMNNLVSNLRVRIPENSPMLNLNKDLIAMKNGVFNILTGEFYSHAENTFDWTYKVDIPFVEDAYSKDVDKFLSDLANDDPEIMRILTLPFVYALFPGVRYIPLIFFIVGEGANGKSVYARLGEKLIGSKYSFNIDPNLFANRFAVSNLVGKLYAYGADIPDTYLDANACAKLKSFSGDDNIFIEAKGKDGVSYKGAKPTLLFACNRIPDFDDKDPGFTRRLVIIEAKRTFTEAKNNIDPNMFEKLSRPGALQYFMRLVIQHAMSIRRNERINLPQIIIDMQTQAGKDGDSLVRAFIADKRSGNEKYFRNLKTDKAYKDFINWCCTKRVPPLFNNVFGKLLVKHANLKSVSKHEKVKSYRYYWPADEVVAIEPDSDEEFEPE